MREPRARAATGYSPRQISRYLRRPLRGEANPPSGEYRILHLINEGQEQEARVLLDAEPPDPAFKADFVGYLRHLLKNAAAPRPPKKYVIALPAPVFDRYAQRSREQHIRLSDVLIEALVRDDERLLKARVDGTDEGEAMRHLLERALVAMSELRRELGRPGAGEAVAGSPSAVPAVLKQIVEAVEESRAQAANHTVALAAVLQAVRKTLPETTVRALKTEGWLT